MKSLKQFIFLEFVILAQFSVSSIMEAQSPQPMNSQHYSTDSNFERSCLPQSSPKPSVGLGSNVVEVSPSFKPNFSNHSRFKFDAMTNKFDRETARQRLFQSLQLTDDQRISCAQLVQGSDEWKAARRNRLTASNFGAAVGHNRFKSPSQLVYDMLYGDFDGNDATRWGSAHEALACSEYTASRRALLARAAAAAAVLPKPVRFEVASCGLMVSGDSPWLAVSPDGLVREDDVDGLLEIKCPYSKRPYDSIPPHYMDQIQGIMGVLGLPWADFCVWTPTEISIQRVTADRDYWGSALLPALYRYFHDQFVPAYVAREERHAYGDFSVPPYSGF